MPASAPVPTSDSYSPQPHITTRALLREVVRIGWSEGVKRRNKTPAWRWIERIYLILALALGSLAGGLTRDGDSLVDRITRDPIFIKIALLYVGYEAVMKVVEVVQDDKQEFDDAVKWMTYPVRVGAPVAAVGFLIGDNAAGVLANEESLARTLTIVGVCLILLAGGLLRAAYVALNRRNMVATELAESPEGALAPTPA